MKWKNKDFNSLLNAEYWFKNDFLDWFSARERRPFSSFNFLLKRTVGDQETPVLILGGNLVPGVKRDPVDGLADRSI